MNTQSCIQAFIKLGELINCNNEDFKSKMAQAETYNPWFTQEMQQYTFNAWKELLQESKLLKWLSNYSIPAQIENPKTIAIIMAGNIPLVGFHDLLSVLLSGHHALIKLSTSDDILLPFLSKKLIEIEPEFKNRISFSENKLTNFDAVIATGSDNAARYFEQYFGKYPHIIRKNRNSIAVITGNETDIELSLIADDIMLYFGLGCRSVSKIYIPEHYDFNRLFVQLEKYQEFRNHNKFFNNYEYCKAIYLINADYHWDTGYALFKPSKELASPVSVVHTEDYKSINEVNVIINDHAEKIQCVVSTNTDIKNSILPGTTQQPALWDYADGVDTIHFLLTL